MQHSNTYLIEHRESNETIKETNKLISLLQSKFLKTTTCNNPKCDTKIIHVAKYMQIN